MSASPRKPPTPHEQPAALLALSQAGSSRRVSRLIRALNIEPDGRTPAETAAFIKDEVQRWGQVIRANKIVLE
jgi:tripartite-type tricarboxylate transporter receptor subunit TctC